MHPAKHSRVQVLACYDRPGNGITRSSRAQHFYTTFPTARLRCIIVEGQLLRVAKAADATATKGIERNAKRHAGRQVAEGATGPEREAAGSSQAPEDAT